MVRTIIVRAARTVAVKVAVLRLLVEKSMLKMMMATNQVTLPLQTKLSISLTEHLVRSGRRSPHHSL